LADSAVWRHYANPRFNEVFTSVAAARFMWMPGFPAGHEYQPEGVPSPDV
jgi:hypothetical protein